MRHRNQEKFEADSAHGEEGRVAFSEYLLRHGREHERPEMVVSTDYNRRLDDSDGGDLILPDGKVIEVKRRMFWRGEDIPGSWPVFLIGKVRLHTDNTLGYAVLNNPMTRYVWVASSTIKHWDVVGRLTDRHLDDRDNEDQNWYAVPRASWPSCGIMTRRM